MKISIITICFNSADTIEDTFKSVAAQDYPDIEYIVVDGGSTDGTVEIIKRNERLISRWVSEPDKGLFDALNKGIKMASGDLVGILHADDIYGSHKVISLIARAMEKDPFDACWGDLVYVSRDNPDKVVRFWKSSPYKKGSFRFGWMPPHVTFFARKSLFDKYGYYNLNLKLAADYELMLRFIKVNQVKTRYFPVIFTKMRVGGVSDRSWRNIKMILTTNYRCYQAWKVNKLKGGWLVPILKPLSKLFQSFKKPPASSL